MGVVDDDQKGRFLRELLEIGQQLGAHRERVDHTCGLVARLRPRLIVEQTMQNGGVHSLERRSAFVQRIQQFGNRRIRRAVEIR